MKNVEDDFQDIDGRIIDDDLESFKKADLTVINEFYCLWNLRAIHKQNRVNDQSIYVENLLGLSSVYTKDEQEQLEKEGISTIRGDFKIAGRFLASPSIRLQVTQAAKAMGDSDWNILRAVEGEFIVPDNAKRMSM